MRIAITGHRDLPAETKRLIDRAIREQLAAYPSSELIGVSNLADGADQLFAQAVLDAGGQLAVIVPAVEYRDGLPEAAHATYDLLLSRAASVKRLDRIESTEDAHMEASQAMLDRADACSRCGTASPPAATAAPPTWWQRHEAAESRSR